MSYTSDDITRLQTEIETFKKMKLFDVLLDMVQNDQKNIVERLLTIGCNEMKYTDHDILRIEHKTFTKLFNYLLALDSALMSDGLNFDHTETL